MRNRWLLNLAMLLIVIGLIVLVLYAPERDKRTTEQQPKLTELVADKVRTIRIERAEKEPITLAKDAQGSWQLTAPLTLPANRVRVDNLLKLLSIQRYTPIDPTKVKLAELKLDPPLAKVSFDQVTFAFGDSSPLNDGQRYIQLNQAIYLMTDTIYYTLNGDAANLVSLSPLGQSPKINELQLPDYHLIRKEGNWTLATPTASDINQSPDNLNSLIDNWQHLQAISVKRYVDSPAKGDIKITLEGQTTPLQLTLLSTEPEFTLALPNKGVQYQLATNQVDKLLHLPKKTLPTDSKSQTTIPK